MSPLKYLLLCLALALPVFPAAPGGSYLGLSVSDATADEGVQIVRVTNESPAAKAGLKPGDVLLSYNGEAILGGQQLGRLVWETPPGRHVKVQFSRDGKQQSITLVTAAPPAVLRVYDTAAGGLAEPPPSAFSDIPIPSIVWRNMLLGIEYEALSPPLASSFGVRDGVLIRATGSGSPAEKAGLKPGDVLVEINGHPTGDRQDLSNCLRLQNTPGKTIQVAVMRNHKRLDLTLQLGE